MIEHRKKVIPAQWKFSGTICLLLKTTVLTSHTGIKFVNDHYDTDSK